MSDADEQLLVTLPSVVFNGPVAGPGTQLVLVFDCPVPNSDGPGYIFGRLFLVAPKPPEPDMIVYPAGRDAYGAPVAGRPYGDVLGISTVSVDDALTDARTNGG